MLSSELLKLLRSSARPLCLLFAITGFQAEAQEQQPYKLSGDMVLFGDAESFQISPDGNTVVYKADQVTDGEQDLFSVPIEGGTIRQLNSFPFGNGTTGSVTGDIITENSQRVVFLASPNGVRQVFSVPIGGGTPRQISPTPGSNSEFIGRFKVSLDSSTVVADIANISDYSLISFPVVPPIFGGPNPTVPLNAFGGAITDLYISADSNHVVYNYGFTDIYSVPIGGGDTVEIYNATAGGSAFSSPPSPDSNRIVFTGDITTTPEQYELYSVPITGGARIRLNGNLPGVESDVGVSKISPDSQYVVYQAQQNSPIDFDLFSVPIAGGTPTQINSNIIEISSEFESNRIEFTPDSAQIIFLGNEVDTDRQELFRTPVSGGTPIRINAALSPGGNVQQDFAISPDGSQIVYKVEYPANADNDFTTQLFSASTDGSRQPILLANLVRQGTKIRINSILIDANSKGVAFRSDQKVSGRYDVYYISLTGGELIQLNQDLPFNGSIDSFALSSDGERVVYLGDALVFAEDEIFARRLPALGNQETTCFPIKSAQNTVAIICM